MFIYIDTLLWYLNITKSYIKIINVWHVLVKPKRHLECYWIVCIQARQRRVTRLWVHVIWARVVKFKPKRVDLVFASSFQSWLQHWIASIRKPSAGCWLRNSLTWFGRLFMSFILMWSALSRVALKRVWRSILNWTASSGCRVLCHADLLTQYAIAKYRYQA